MVTATLRSALSALGGGHLGWVMLGLALTIASMVAYGGTRRWTLKAAGARISLAEATAVGYAAGAVHLTAPAGSVIATGYAFRRLQRKGLAPAAITWSLAVSGVVSTVTLAMLAAIGMLAGDAGSWSTFLPGLAGAVLIAGGSVWAVRHPDRVARAAERGLRRVNAVVRRPSAAGVMTLRSTIEDLRQVRPSGRHWTAVMITAALNWLLDLLCLWACAHAVGLAAGPVALMTCYALAMAGVSVTPLPGGIGVVDTVLVLGLTATGAPVATALVAVLLYRALSAGSVIAIGWTAIGARALLIPRRRAAHAQPTTSTPV